MAFPKVAPPRENSETQGEEPRPKDVEPSAQSGGKGPITQGRPSLNTKPPVVEPPPVAVVEPPQKGAKRGISRESQAKGGTPRGPKAGPLRLRPK
jgi:hypothetical protein